MNDNALNNNEANVDGTVETKVVSDPRNDDMGLKYIDKDFLYSCMSVPSYSMAEFRLVTFIILWARRNNILYEFDEAGNLYLTKGSLDEGESYPCVTSHLDSVQDRQKPYIYANVPLDIKTEVTKEGLHKISVDAIAKSSPIGIGADDKGGICICLSLFSHFDKLKACFFLNEENGCIGSKDLDVEWFEDVGYVIGYDSPELKRAAWSCSGVKLFNYKFYEEHMKSVCDKWGLKDCFYSEPITDVMNIRKFTDIICMNFGNGGYNAHTTGEYSIIEHMDDACGMGVDLIKSIGNTKHLLKHNAINTYVKKDDGTYSNEDAEDDLKLESLGDDKRYSSYGGYYNKNAYKSQNQTSGTTSQNNAYKKKATDDSVQFDTLKYIVDRYDSHILSIKEELVQKIKSLCEDKKLDESVTSEFNTIIQEAFDNEIKF